jgi:hypothetical protein
MTIPLVIIILAQGKGLRWKDVPEAHVMAPPVGIKQLIPVLGEPLIVRTYRQFREACGVDPIIVAGKDLCTILGPQYRGFTLSDPGGSRAREGVAATATEGVWAGGADALFLLGDVMFSDLAVRLIRDEIQRLSGTAEDRFVFGRRNPNPVSEKEASECYALFIGARSYDATLDLLRRMADPRSGVDCPKPWGFPRLVRELPSYVRCDRGMWQLPIGWMLESGDYTDDCDSMVEYIAFWPKMEEAARKERDEGWRK